MGSLKFILKFLNLDSVCDVTDPQFSNFDFFYIFTHFVTCIFNVALSRVLVINHVIWPTRVGEHIAANFSDGFYIGEVMDIIDDDTIKVSYMSPKRITTVDQEEHMRRVWIWPSNRDIFDTYMSCIINLKPSLSLETPPSTKRQFGFACHNTGSIGKQCLGGNLIILVTINFSFSF